MFSKFRPRHIYGILFTILGAIPAFAETYHIDPGNPDGHGTAAKPWADLDTAFNSGKLKSGDELILHQGNYGNVIVRGWDFSNPIRIAAAPGEMVHFNSLKVQASRNLIFDGLSIWPVNRSPAKGALVVVAPRAKGIELHRFDIRSRKDAASYMKWAKADWQNHQLGGILMQGSDGVISDSTITAISGGMGISGDNARVTGNVIRGFSQDGVVGIGNNLVFQNNRIQDCVAINSNHDDGFQSWATGADGAPGRGVVEGLTIEGNTILQWTGDLKHPLACSLQGIGMFDGMYKDLIIRNNIISVSAYHGITVSGAINAEISHNTVINPLGPRRDSPWIEVNAHKNGTPSRNVTMANNAAPIVRMNPSFGTFSGNIKMIYPGQEIVAPYAGDFRPLPGGRLDGHADPAFAAATDILGQRRPLGAGPDIGAIEIP